MNRFVRETGYYACAELIKIIKTDTADPMHQVLFSLKNVQFFFLFFQDIIYAHLFSTDWVECGFLSIVTNI